jgi:hypothetical protein
MAKRTLVPSVAAEFDGAQLGDERRSRRLKKIVTKLAAEPSESFPKSMGSESALEAFYRFINNCGFSSAAVLQPHIDKSLIRAGIEDSVLAIHDTTTLNYPSFSPRQGMGRTTPGLKQGFYAHTSLLVAEDGLPLGVGHMELYSRAGKPIPAKRPKMRENAKNPKRESLRWVRAVEKIEHDKPKGLAVVHVADAEGDFYELLSRTSDIGAKFVVRAAQLTRIVTDDSNKNTAALASILETKEPIFQREISLTERRYRVRKVPKEHLKKHPPRKARTTTVNVSVASITIEKTESASTATPSIELHAIRIWEPKAPKGDKPIEWVLLTNEPVDSRAALERIVDIYRKRWLIEEFFKALKYGCAIEKRQVESFDGLCDILAICAPIAYRLLFIRALHRTSKEGQARALFDHIDIKILQSAESNAALGPIKTLDDEILHLARFGGHLKRNGDPGWETLGRGYEKLLIYRAGWEAAMDSLEFSK